MRRPVLLCLALMLVAALTSRTSGASRSLQIIDLTPAFAEIWLQTKTMPEKARVSALKSYFADLLPGYYVSGRIDWLTQQEYDEDIGRALARFPEERIEIEEVSKRFTLMFSPALRDFETIFGSMAAYPQVYLVHSIGEFDGGTRRIQNGRFLIFGADVIAKIHRGQNIRPFFHHELFHLYHERRFAECDAVWCKTWSEGLAVYVAEQLNPGASDAELLLTLPKPIRSRVDANRNLAICSIIANLDATDSVTTGALFSSGKARDPKLPARYAYYVGYLAVAKLGLTQDLKTLASMDHGKVRPLLERTLRGMADC